MSFLLLDVEPHPCVIIDAQITRAVDELEQSGRHPSATDLEKFCKEVDALRKNPRAIWEKRPGSDIQQVIEKQLPPIAIIKQEAATIKVGFKGRPPKYTSVSSFQAHILARIEYQAQLVEKVLLGDAKTIKAELRKRLAQTWSLIRDEADVAGIVAELAGHGCPDVTWELDRVETSLDAPPTAKCGPSNVWKGTLLDGRNVALKRMRFPGSIHERLEYSLQDTVRQLYAWEKARHENILELLGMAIFDGGIAMVSPWMESGSIIEHLVKHPNIDRLSMCVQVARGVAHLHGIPLIHGDIKGGNIYVTNDRIVKIGDFGAARLPGEKDSQLSNAMYPWLALRWAAPELLVEENQQRTLETDVYALGMTILEIITGRIPFREMSQDSHVKDTVARRKGKPSLPSQITSLGESGNRLWDLLNQCWDDDPKRRPTANHVLQQLEGISKDPA